MVQMKELLVALGKIGRLNFISHMVQMKAKRKLIILRRLQLYIPHGSDERYSELGLRDLIKDTLYPTWFR